MGTDAPISVDPQAVTSVQPAKNFKIARKLTNRQVHAVTLVAEDRLADVKIAERVGVSARQLATWKKLPEFDAAVEKSRDIYAKKVLGSGIGQRHKRVEILQDLAERHRFVIQDRGQAAANDPEMAAVPGAKSGLLTKTSRTKTTNRRKCSSCGGTGNWPIGSTHGCAPCNGTGRLETVEVEASYEVDTGLTSELRATLRQVSEEVGQLTVKHEVTGADGGPITIDVVSTTISQHLLTLRDLRRRGEVVEVGAEPGSLVAGQNVPGDIGKAGAATS